MNLRDGHNALIIPPLAIILVSCFVFVLMQPNTAKKATPSASTPSTPSLSQPKSALSMAQVTMLPMIEPTVIVVDPATTGGPSNISTTTPQPINSSITNLQAADGNNQSTTPIKVPAPVRSLIKDMKSTNKKTTTHKN
ncbi:MAG: hypothetical protein JWO35_20 [Candidatus Saccharibacteria bacterium]|nr:hypothetical protein [Candidatus Saccharibacteria bacterium]